MAKEMVSKLQMKIPEKLNGLVINDVISVLTLHVSLTKT